MAFLLLPVTWFSWGVAYPVTGIALGGFDILTLRVLVQILGAAALGGQGMLSGISFRVEREAWPDLVITALLYMTIMPICMTLGMYLMSPGRTSMLIYTMPIWASLFARPLLGERFTAPRLVALTLGAAAVVSMVSQDLSSLRNAPLGAALALVAAMAFGLGTVWLKRRRWRANSSAVAFWQLVIGLVPLIFIWLIVSFPPDLASVMPVHWLALLFLGVISNGIAYFAWFRIVRVLPASVSGISSLAVPCVAVSASALMTGERLGPHDLLAMALIGAALATVLGEQLRLRPRLS
ncbi:MAG TPA: DMT family transporter [Stellaceae bacterium]|nr:DMT family transporter [Stellaceae bacterium]